MTYKPLKEADLISNCNNETRQTHINVIMSNSSSIMKSEVKGSRDRTVTCAEEEEEGEAKKKKKKTTPG
jgi:hypothetical protein